MANFSSNISIHIYKNMRFKIKNKAQNITIVYRDPYSNVNNNFFLILFTLFTFEN